MVDNYFGRPIAVDERVGLGQLFQIGDISFFCGLRWANLKVNALASISLGRFSSEGFNVFVPGSFDDLLGMGFVEKAALAKSPKSFALAVSEFLSTGGPELFAYRWENGIAIAGLYNGSPLPGFDYLAHDDESFYAKLEQFRDFHSDVGVRIAANFDIDPTTEVVSFDRLSKLARSECALRRIVPKKPLLIGTGVAVGVLLLSIGGVLLKDVLFPPPPPPVPRVIPPTPIDPNDEYRRQVNSAIELVQSNGPRLFEHWRSFLVAVPVSISSWRVNGIACNPDVCTLSWSRGVDNHSELLSVVSQLPGYTTYELDYSTYRVISFHELGSLTDEDAADEPDITPTFEGYLSFPTLNDLHNEFVSELQDISLVNRFSATLSAPNDITGGNTPPNILEPLYQGSWNLEVPLWALSEVVVPDYVSFRSAEVNWHAGSSAPAVVFSGDYYAR